MVRTFILQWHLSENCNLKCLHCYQEDHKPMCISYKKLEHIYYEFINLMKYEGIDIYIEINNSKETNNYNMFMDISNIIVPEDFISINEKYVEIWKDMNINFIININSFNYIKFVRIIYCISN